MLNDPLNVSVETTGVDTTVPLLPEADYLVKIIESTLDVNKAQTGFNWNLKLGLVTGTTAVDGRQVQPDFPLFFLGACQPGPESKDKEAFKRQLAAAQDAILGSDMSSRPRFDINFVKSVVGRQVVAHAVQEEYQGQMKNKVSYLKPVPTGV